MSVSAVQLAGVPAARSSFTPDLTGDLDGATAATIARMCELVRASAGTPEVQRAAGQAWNQWGVRAKQLWPALSDGAARAWACWWWVKHRMRFKEDDVWLRAQVGEADQLEGLISPDLAVQIIERNGKCEGDCDDFTMLCCAMLQAMGLDWRISTVKANPMRPDLWSHVYGLCVLPDGTTQAMDASHGVYPGWEVPGRHCFRYAEWDSSGNRITDVAVNPPMSGYTKGGAMSYSPMGMGQLRGLRGGRGLGRRGMGRWGLGDPNSTTTIDLPWLTSPDSGVAPMAYPDWIAAGSPADVPVNLPPATGGGITQAPVSSTPSWASILANEAGQFTKIAGQVLAPQVTATGPGGTSVTGPAGAVSAPNVNPFSNISAAIGSSSSFLPIILIGGVVLLVFAGGRHK